MGYRDDALRARLKSYLERRAMPRHLDGKPQALAEEIDALFRAVSRFAPRDGYEDWWPKFTDRLDEGRRVSTWPTVGEIRAAAQAVTGPETRHLASGDEFDPLAVIGGRMERGEAVPDGYLYGRLAVDLIVAGRVTEETMKRYRSAWFFNAKKVYGEEKALAKEAELKARHDTARAAHRQNAEPRDLPRPDPRKMQTYDWDGAK